MGWFNKFTLRCRNAARYTILSKIRDFKIVEDFYQGEADFTQAFRRAAAANIPVFLPNKAYSINTPGGPIEWGALSSLIGVSIYSTVITDNATAGTGSTFTLSRNNGGMFANFTLQRTPSSKGGSGALIDSSGVTVSTTIMNLGLNYGFNGLALGGGGGTISGVFCYQNAQDGVNIQQAGAASATWPLLGVQCGLNGRHGLCIEGPQTSVSDWINVKTQANGQYGIAVLPGSGGKAAIRIYSAFIGDDAAGGIYLDPGGTFSGQRNSAPHMISNSYIETTGGAGITATSTCLNLDITNTRIVGCANHGIHSSAETLGVIGGQILNNNDSGVMLPSGGLVTGRIMGVRIAPDGQGCQTIGIKIGDSPAPSALTIIGCDLAGSRVPISPASASWLRSTGNII